MAEFTVMEQEGVRFVHVRLHDDTIRMEAGALAWFRGKLALRAAIPSVATFVKSSLSEESAVRPTITGTGEVVLESSLGGFHVFDLGGEDWILERGAFWASDDEIRVGAYREKMLNSLFGGEGLIDFATRVSGTGQVVLNARGPVREVKLEVGERYAAETKGVVVARSIGVRFSMRRPARSIIGSWISGEKILRVFEGPGRILTAPTPYWGAFLLEKMGARVEGANAVRPRPEHDENRATGSR